MRFTRNRLRVEWASSRIIGTGILRQRPIAEQLELTEEEWDTLVPIALEAWPVNQPAIVYCSSLQRENNTAAAERLREFDLAPVFVLKGGWEAWLDAQKKLMFVRFGNCRQ